ncbi:MAG TPA: histidine kinase dimerization/phosphoacceptor domain -containing protein [Chitinophagaceae bacterium]
MFIIKPFARSLLFAALAAASPLLTDAQQNTALQDSIQQLLLSQRDDTVKVNLLNTLARSYLESNRDTLLTLTQSSIRLAEQLHYDKGKATALLYTAICYRLNGDYSLALEKCLEATRLREEMKAGPGTSEAYVQLAQIYKGMSGANNTEEYLNRGIAYGRVALGWAENSGDTAAIVNSLNVIGILYRDKAMEYDKPVYYDTAFNAYTKAVALINQSGKATESLAKLYNNISQVYGEHKKDFRTALSWSFKAVELNKSNHNLSSLTFNYGNISSDYLSLEDYPQALFYARQMLEAARQLKQPERVQNAYKDMYDAFRGAGQTDSALNYYILADELNDSLTNIRKARQVMDLQTKYETAKKEAEIARLQTESGSKNKRIYGLIAVASLLSILVAGLLLLYQRMKKQRQQITEQSGRLEVMMKELHHRVKNNLQIVSSLLSLQAYKLQDEGTISVLRESQLRVQAMSFIHQRLYKQDTLTAVNMKEYLTDLAESLLSSYGYGKDDFDLLIKVEKELLDIDKAMPIGLIINEIVTNALKYAYVSIDRPSLEIMLTETDQQLICRVKDNGIGINENDWKQQNDSFGKQLIKALCRQLRAEQQLLIESGTQFTFTIPKRAA